MNKAFPDKLRETALVALLCIIVIAAVFYPAVFQGKLIFQEDGTGSDSLDLNITRRCLAVQSLTKYGEFPLWEPRIACGAPLFAESEAGVLYPAILFFFLNDLTLAANLTVLSAVLIAMLGCYSWSRCLGMEPPASGMAALAYGLSYSFLLRTEQLNIIHVIAWLPASLAVINLWITTERKRYLFILTTIWTGQLLAGHFQMTAICQTCCWLYIFWLIVCRRENGQLPRSQKFAVLVLSLFFAVSLTAVQWLPTRELTNNSTRSGAVPIEQLNATSTSWHMLRIYLNPFYLEYSSNPQEQAPRNKMCFYAREWFHYLGILPFLLSFLSLSAKRIRRVWGLWLMAIFFLFASLGPKYGIYYFLWRFIPFMNAFRVPGRFAVPITCIIAVLAAAGTQNLTDCIKKKYNNKASRLISFIIITATCLDLGYVNSQVQGYLPRQWDNPPAAAVSLKNPQRIYSPCSGTAWRNYLEYTYSCPDKRYEPYWQHRSLLAPGLAPIWNIYAPDDYAFHGGGIILKYAYAQQLAILQLMRQLDSLPPQEAALIIPKLCKWFRVLHISHIITPAPLPPSWPSEEFKELNIINIPELPGAQTFVYQFDQPLALVRLTADVQNGVPPGTLDLGKVIGFNDSQGLYERDLGSPSNIGSVSLKTVTNHKIIAETSCDQSACLIVSNTYDENWQAFIDEIPTKIQRTNLCMQSVFVPSGQHKVRLQYASPAFELGYKISLISLLLFLSLTATAIIKSVNKKNEQSA